MSTVFELVGAALVTVGAFLLSIWLGFVVAGVALAVLGWLLEDEPPEVVA